MQKSLNFGKEHKKEIKQIMQKYPLLKTNTEFEEGRWKAGNSVVSLYSTGKLSVQGIDCGKVAEMILEKFDLKEEIVLGIDETGRGESHGVFVISAVLGESNKLRELRDSKKTKNIEEKAKIALQNSIANAKIEISPELIDKLREKGMTMDEIEAKAINCFVEFFGEIAPKAKIKADGSRLKGSSSKIEFIVKGDDLEPVIGAASVLAKHYRNESPNKQERKSWKKKTN